jgi:hypothetical protein
MKNLVGTLCLTAAVLLGCAEESPDPFQTGLDAGRTGDFATALREFRPLAEQGNARVQTYLGFMYDRGEGVAQDYVEAGRWFRLAAEQGYAYAQNNLGRMYRNGNGRGVAQDYVEAVRCQLRRRSGHCVWSSHRGICVN